MDVNELINREYIQETTVTNCVAHIELSIMDRPNYCHLCHSDVKNALSRVIEENEWLHEWKKDATEVIKSLSERDQLRLPKAWE